jgi:indole-3-glycerol phosphate synthase
MQRTALIGEIKRASPSKGDFLPEGAVFDAAEQARRCTCTLYIS